MEEQATYNTYPEIRYEEDVVYIPHYLTDQIPHTLLKQWHSRGLTVQIEIG